MIGRLSPYHQEGHDTLELFEMEGGRRPKIAGLCGSETRVLLGLPFVSIEHCSRPQLQARLHLSALFVSTSTLAYVIA